MSREERSVRTANLLASAATLPEDSAERERRLADVVEINVRVAHAIAARYRNRGVSIEDLEQVACLGLVKAARNFDVTQERDFLTYAVPTMRGEVQRYFRDFGWQVRPPRPVQQVQTRVIEAYRQAQERYEPTDAASLGRRLDLSPELVTEALTASNCFTPMSLDRRLGGSQTLSLGEAIIDEEAGSDERAAEARTMLAPALRDLSERDRRILFLRFVEDRSQAEIGDEIGVTQMQVSRLLTRIYRDARTVIGETEQTNHLVGA